MTWELVQAGNRASKTGRYLQWWENKQEQDAVNLCACRTHTTALNRGSSQALVNHLAMECEGAAYVPAICADGLPQPSK